MRLCAQFLCEAPRAGNSHRRDVGGLALLRVLSRRLAERCRARIIVEHVIDDLESEADRLGVFVQLLLLRLRVASAGNAEQHRGSDERPGLANMHELELGKIERLAGSLEVDLLAARHAARAGGERQCLHHFELAARIIRDFVFRD